MLAVGPAVERPGVHHPPVGNLRRGRAQSDEKAYCRGHERCPRRRSRDGAVVRAAAAAAATHCARRLTLQRAAGRRCGRGRVARGHLAVARRSSRSGRDPQRHRPHARRPRPHAAAREPRLSTRGAPSVQLRRGAITEPPMYIRAACAARATPAEHAPSTAARVAQHARAQAGRQWANIDCACVVQRTRSGTSGSSFTMSWMSLRSSSSIFFSISPIMPIFQRLGRGAVCAAVPARWGRTRLSVGAWRHRVRPSRRDDGRRRGGARLRPRTGRHRRRWRAQGRGVLHRSAVRCGADAGQPLPRAGVRALPLAAGPAGGGGCRDVHRQARHISIVTRARLR